MNIGSFPVCPIVVKKGVYSCLPKGIHVEIESRPLDFVGFVIHSSINLVIKLVIDLVVNQSLLF